jgi:hypothetical protein
MRGWCMKHYTRWLRTGTTELAPRHERRRTGDGRPGWLYVVGEVDDHGPVKVGLSCDVGHRLSGLQAGNPRELEVVHQTAVPDMGLAERSVHRRLEAWLVRGEWYDIRHLVVDDWDQVLLDDPLVIGDQAADLSPMTTTPTGAA